MKILTSSSNSYNVIMDIKAYKNNHEIRAYSIVTAFFLTILDYLRIGPGVVRVQDGNGKNFWLNRKSLVTWINQSLVDLKVNDASLMSEDAALVAGERDSAVVSGALTRTIMRVNLIAQIVVKSKNTPIPKNAINSGFQPSAGVAHLEGKIKELRLGKATDQKKADFYDAAVRAYQTQPGKSPFEIFSLSRSDLSKFDYCGNLDYLAESFTPLKTDIISRAGFYNYANGSHNEEVFWVDFANRNLGGGAFEGDCFVQEEILAVEMPEFANYLAENPHATKAGRCRIETRRSNTNTDSKADDSDRVGRGNPNPLLLKGLSRVLAVAGYGDVSKAKVTAVPYPQKVNLLAIAALKLSSKNLDKQIHEHTITDLFSTFLAGFTLAGKNADLLGKKCVIETGAIGCGAFKNNKHLVALLQLLAAQYCKVDVHFNGYSDREIDSVRKSWNDICNQPGKKLNDILLAIGNATRNAR